LGVAYTQTDVTYKSYARDALPALLPQKFVSSIKTQNKIVNIVTGSPRYILERLSRLFRTGLMVSTFDITSNIIYYAREVLRYTAT
jgi:hypothetical protein